MRCRGFDKAGYQVAVEDRLIEGAVEGPIVPGFKIRKELDSRRRNGIASTTCGVARAEAEPTGR